MYISIFFMFVSNEIFTAKKDELIVFKIVHSATSFCYKLILIIINTMYMILN